MIIIELLKLVLVDDEAILLQGLLETYHWEEMGFAVAGIARSGEEAIEVISETLPHVVLCDIRMKQISGLMVMEETKKTNPDIQFVFLSAYRDFEYAKKACDLGAISYLLKPVEDEELSKTMLHAWNVCMEQIRKEEKQESWERLLKTDATNFVQVVVQKYLQNRISREKAEHVFSLLGDMDEHDMFITVCTDIDISYKITNQLEYEAARLSLIQYLEETIRRDFFAWQFESDEAQLVFLVRTRDPGAVRQLKQLMEQARKHLDSPMIASISKPYKGLPGMKKSYEEGIRLFDYASASGASAFTAAIELEPETADRYAEEEEQLIISAIRKNDEPELKQAYIKFVYALPGDRELQSRYLHRMMLQTEFVIRESYGLSDELKHTFQNYYENLYGLEAARSVDVCYKILVQAVTERKRCIDNREADYFSEYMSTAVAYIEEHLSDEDLSIVAVANYIYLNPVYFGRVFKNTFHMTFKKYLLQQRMEKAKKMIQAGKDSIAVICEKVGISNPSYFSHLFKQYTGMLPSEYKKEFEV